MDALGSREFGDALCLMGSGVALGSRGTGNALCLIESSDALEDLAVLWALRSSGDARCSGGVWRCHGLWKI